MREGLRCGQGMGKGLEKDGYGWFWVELDELIGFGNFLLIFSKTNKKCIFIELKAGNNLVMAIMVISERFSRTPC